MLSLTRKSDYALVALASLARAAPDKLSAREIAERYRVPLPLLMNVLTELVRHGMISSTRGVKGGYRLARAPEDITLAQLIEAIEGPVRLTLCCHGESGEESEPRTEELECSLMESCPVRDPVRKVHAILHRFLDEVTLAHLLSDEELIQLGLAHGIGKEDYEPVGAMG